MDTMTRTDGDERDTREPVLDTVDRVSELCFGLFMSLTFVGAVSAVTAGEDAGARCWPPHWDAISHGGSPMR